MEIPYVNISGQSIPIKKQLLRAVEKVINRGDFICGKEVSEFERRFAELCGTHFSIGVNSGTDALIIALRALDIGHGDEVITVPNSFITTTSSIITVGARPVFVDVQNDYNIDPEQIEQVITPKTKAILPVHLTGRPADMDPILQVSEKYGLYVIEDCAQAILADYKGQRVGSFGTIGCFSLHPLKNLNACGDGGMLTVSDKAIYERIKLLRNMGLKTRDDCILWSNNSRLDTIQAAMLLVKLDYLENWTLKRRKNAKYYQNKFAGLNQIRFPMDKSYEKSVYHTFVIQVENRDELKIFLHNKGIGSAIHYPIPIHFQPAAKELHYKKGDFPVTESQAQHILSLPVHQDLHSSDIEYIVENIIEFYKTT